MLATRFSYEVPCLTAAESDVRRLLVLTNAHDLINDGSLTEIAQQMADFRRSGGPDSLLLVDKNHDLVNAARETIPQWRRTHVATGAMFDLKDGRTGESIFNVGTHPGVRASIAYCTQESVIEGDFWYTQLVRIFGAWSFETRWQTSYEKKPNVETLIRHLENGEILVPGEPTAQSFREIIVAHWDGNLLRPRAFLVPYSDEDDACEA